MKRHTNTGETRHDGGNSVVKWLTHMMAFNNQVSDIHGQSVVTCCYTQVSEKPPAIHTVCLLIVHVQSWTIQRLHIPYLPHSGLVYKDWPVAVLTLS